MKESVITRKILDKLRAAGHLAIGLNASLLPGLSGIPDILCILADRKGVLFIEVKRLDGQLSLNQQVMHRFLKKFGEVIVVWGYEEALQKLDCFLK